LNEVQHQIALQIIGSIDEDGYLRRNPEAICDDLAFNKNIITDLEEVRFVIKEIQQFDPPGVAAKDLRECLLLQLENMPESREVKNAKEILKDFFPEFTRKNYTKILNRTFLSEEDISRAINVIIKLSPKPGLPFSADS